jgi:hypothetical protein
MLNRWMHEPPDGQPPLAGRLLGLSLTLLVLALVVRLLADTVTILVPLTVPLVVLVGIGYAVFRRIGRM